MKPHERHAQILQLLRQNGVVTVDGLSQVLHVSKMTVRRDLNELQSMSLLNRHHGGASLAPERGDTEWPFMLRESEHLEEKRRIGRAAAAFVKGGEVVLMDGGSTTLHVARHLMQDRLTVVTNCLPTLSVLSSRRNINLMAIGGMFYPDNQCFIGPVAVGDVKEINAHIAFMATSCLSLKKGLTNRKLEEAEVKRAMIEAAEKVILVMDSSKMHSHTLATVGPIEVVDVLVTDSGLACEDREAIEARGVTVVMADDEPQPAAPGGSGQLPGDWIDR